MRDSFRSLSRERRDRRKKKRFWESLPPTLLISLTSLLISISSTTLSYFSYKISEDSRKQPYRSAIYSIKLDSYQRFAAMVSDWITLVSEESEINAALLSAVDKLKVDSKITTTLIKRNSEFIRLVTRFYRLQVLERLYWPNVRNSFDAFDKSIDRMARCGAIRDTFFKLVRTNKIDSDKLPMIIQRLEGRCKFRILSQNGEMQPYADLLRSINEDLGMNKVGLDNSLGQ